MRSARELLEELKSKGEKAFLDAHTYPVLLGFGLAGKIERPQDRESQAVERTRAVNLGTLCENALLWKNLPIELRPVRGSPDTHEIKIGRSGDMDVIIPDFSISRHHCTFERKGSSMTIRDAESRNGTRVGNRLASEAGRLRGGEFITIGRLVFQYLTPHGLVEWLRQMENSL